MPDFVSGILSNIDELSLAGQNEFPEREIYNVIVITFQRGVSESLQTRCNTAVTII